MANPHEDKINGGILYEMAMGAHVTQCIYAVASLNVADLLAEHGKLNAFKLGELTKSNPTNLYRVMSVLVEKGIFSEELVIVDQDLRPITDDYVSTKVHNVLFGMTPLTRALLSDAPYSVKNVCLMMGSPDFYLSTGAILETVKTGKPGFEIVHKTNGMYEHFEGHPEVANVYHSCMEQLCSLGDSALLFSYDFSPFKTIVDVGGGSGALLSRILRKATQSKGVLFESIHALESAKSVFKDETSVSPIISCQDFNNQLPDIKHRCTLVSGNFLQEMPKGGDCYILKNILMDLDIKTCLSILIQVSNAMEKDARVFIIQPIVEVNNQPNMGRTNDLVSLTTTRGCGSSMLGDHEYREVLEAAGLRFDKKVNCLADQTIVEAVKK